MQPIDRLPVKLKMLGLPAHRLLPFDAEPGEVVIDRGLEFRPAAGLVDILDAQQEHPAAAPRQIEIEQRGIGMAEMEPAVRRWGKSENGWRHQQLGATKTPPLTGPGSIVSLRPQKRKRVKP